MSGVSLDLSITLQVGEEALAFLSRLAARNGLPFVRGFCVDQGLDLGRLADGCNTELARLACVSACNFDPVRRGIGVQF